MAKVLNVSRGNTYGKGDSAKKDRAATVEAPKLARKLDKLMKPRVAA